MRLVWELVMLVMLALECTIFKKILFKTILTCHVLFFPAQI